MLKFDALAAGLLLASAASALARLIEKASARTQLWVVSHASRMISALKEAKHCNAITLTKELGETEIEGQGMLDAPPWKWPER